MLVDYLGGWAFGLAVAAAAAIGTAEFFSMPRRAGYRPLVQLGLPAAVG
ncbi:MAG: phosphatidate cytidylyltransferase, partial [Chloroflexi bacterium]|nr:phosphatidate cytidylyltransferase [Chloroflexota bacterium]